MAGHGGTGAEQAAGTCTLRNFKTRDLARVSAGCHFSAAGLPVLRRNPCGFTPPLSQ